MPVLVELFCFLFPLISFSLPLSLEVGWFGFIGPLRQYFSLNRAVSDREKEKIEIQWFQTRINHNILATNNFLHRINYIKDPMCSFKHRLKLLYSISFKAATLEKTMENFLEIWEQFYDLFNENLTLAYLFTNVAWDGSYN